MKKIFAIAIVLLLIGYGWYRFSLRPADASDHVRSSMTIEKGMSTSAIAALLKKQGIIRSATTFTLYAKIHRTSAGLQAGTYFLQPSMSVQEIVLALRKGLAREISLTIPEGYTVKDIDALLAKKGIIAPGEFTACAQTCDVSSYNFLPPAAGLAKRGGRVEGYLYPDTYFVTVDTFTPKSFIDRLLTTFRARVVEKMNTDIAASHRSFHEVMTMASLVEEEAKGSEERKTVAGILWKRFDGMIGLGVDAAVRYIVEKPSSAITKADLDIDSLYNLRKYRGLPPGPIANPGLESIKATLHPADSAYLFYLHDANGVIHYARTNEEHNENRRRYLQ